MPLVHFLTFDHTSPLFRFLSPVILILNLLHTPCFGFLGGRLYFGGVAAGSVDGIGSPVPSVRFFGLFGQRNEQKRAGQVRMAVHPLSRLLNSSLFFWRNDGKTVFSSLFLCGDRAQQSESPIKGGEDTLENDSRGSRENDSRELNGAIATLTLVCPPRSGLQGCIGSAHIPRSVDGPGYFTRQDSGEDQELNLK